MSVPGEPSGSRVGWVQARHESTQLDIWRRRLAGRLLEIFRCPETGEWVRMVDAMYQGEGDSLEFGMRALEHAAGVLG